MNSPVLKCSLEIADINSKATTPIHLNNYYKSSGNVQVAGEMTAFCIFVNTSFALLPNIFSIEHSRSFNQPPNTSVIIIVINDFISFVCFPVHGTEIRLPRSERLRGIAKQFTKIAKLNNFR